MNGSLRSRLMLTVGVMTVVAVAALAIAVRQGARQAFLQFREVERRSTSSALPDLARALAADLDGRCCDAGELTIAVRRLPSEAVALVVNRERGTLLFHAGPALEDAKRVSARLEGGVLSVDAVREQDGRAASLGLVLHVNGIPLRLSDGRPALLFAVPFPSEERERTSAAFLGSLDRRLLAVTIVIAMATLLLTWVIARGIARPLRDLQDATRDLARGNLARRVAPGGGSEVADLAHAFNSMAGELEHQHALRRNLVNDVAHELRTPLTAARCRLEAMLDGLSPDPAKAIAQVHEEVLHLGRLVDDLQELTLAEAGELRLEIGDLHIDAVIESALRAAGLESDPRVQRDAAPGLTARGDALRVRQVLVNLLTNADRYAPPGAAIVVRARRGEEETSVEVENEGSRLDEDQLRHLFDRFYRTDPSRQRVTGGTGLGLAIVKHLVEAQRGRVWAQSAGNRVTVGFALPLSDVPSTPLS